MIYTLISLPFLIGAAVFWWVAAGREEDKHRARRRWYATGGVAAVLLVLTVIFDNLMVAAGFVGYDAANNLGVTVGLIPLEDLYYPLVVALIVGAVWPDRGGERA